MPSRSARSRSAAGSMPRSRVATSVSRPPGSRSSRSSPNSRTAPSSATRLATRWSPGSVSRLSAMPGEPLGVAHEARRSIDSTSSGCTGAQPQGGVDVGGAGRLVTAEVGHGPGQPVDPDGTATAEAALEHLALEPHGAGVEQRPLPRQDRARDLGVEPPRTTGVAGQLALARGCHPLPHLEPRSRARRRPAEGRGASACPTGGTTWRRMSIRSCTGPVTLRA